MPEPTPPTSTAEFEPSVPPRSTSETMGIGAPHRHASRTGVALGRLFGIELRLDWSLLIIFVLIVLELSLGVFPRWHVDWSPAAIWAMAVATAIGFFASILVHELSHALVAHRRGIPVRRITLFLFGGLTQLDAEPATPASEFWMAVVGPLVSLVIGIAATAGGVALLGTAPTTIPGAVPADLTQAAAIEHAFTHAGPGATVLLWLGPINLMLGLFNLVPGFPLDGGRVLRSVLWAITGDLRRATRWASGVGRAFAWALMGLGAFQLFTGLATSGLWLLLIGWFLNNAARASYAQLELRLALAHVPVARVMRSSFVRVAPDLSVEAFVRDYALASDQQVFPVESEGHLLGTVGVHELRSLDEAEWPRTRVDQIMVPSVRLPSLPPDAGAERALTELGRADVDQLAIVDGERLLGLVRREDLLRWSSIHEWMRVAEA